MTATPLTARIEVFRPGTFTPMEGGAITYSAADLRAIADAYDPATAPAPIVVGHPSTNAPAFGWVESFDYDAATERLYANLHEIEPSFAELVKAGRFKKVSMQYFGPDQSHNPVPGTWYPKHVGFLGAAAPAVSGLKNVAFSEAAAPAVTFEVAFGAPAEAASLLRKLRDFLIEQFGTEKADQALPSWQIEWLGDQDQAPAPSFAESLATPDTIPNPEKELPAVTQQSDPAFAAREADLTAREQALADRERAAVHAENLSFAEGLVAAGKLIPASKDKVVAILDALPADAAVSFSEGETLSPAAALRQVLDAQPQVVSFGALDLGEAPAAGGAASFSADGKAVDPEGLATHNKALAYQRAHPGTGYIDAVRAVA
ncbi:hypothetical protein ACFOM8_06040 [Paracoccus angustae]|uniref:Peptidase n=1 Tax=Paracoccus angustae TaxID=1671480 RepID=A0ABV7U1T6_9RHOB